MVSSNAHMILIKHNTFPNMKNYFYFFPSPSPSPSPSRSVGHTGINAQGEDDRWLVKVDISHLSQLVELGIGENLESPSKEF